MQPQHVAIGDAERGEQRGKGVADQCRVEVDQVARADDDEDGQNNVTAIPHSVAFQRSRLIPASARSPGTGEVHGNTSPGPAGGGTVFIGESSSARATRRDRESAAIRAGGSIFKLGNYLAEEGCQPTS